MKSCAGKTVVKEEPVIEPEPDKPVEKSNSLLPVILIIVIAGGGAAVYFLKIRQKKPNADDADESEDYEDEDEIECEYDDENIHE